MTLDQARNLLKIQADFGGTYNRTSARQLLAEVRILFGDSTMQDLINEFNLTEIFGPTSNNKKSI